MVFQYYADTDMLYIRLVDATSTESAEVAPGVVLDFDARNRIIGIELEDASKMIDITRLEVSALPLTSLIVNQPAPVPA